jgi:hypothetical protein
VFYHIQIFPQVLHTAQWLQAAEALLESTKVGMKINSSDLNLLSSEDYPF